MALQPASTRERINQGDIIPPPVPLWKDKLSQGNKNLGDPPIYPPPAIIHGFKNAFKGGF